MTENFDSRLRGAALLLVALLTLAYVAAGVAAVGYYDTYRDLYYVSRIASGDSFPLAGPLIYNTIHVGPVWWYLLGAAAALFGSLSAALLLALTLAALKYLLAWQLGRRLGSERLGLLFVVALAMPGWSLLSAGATTHSSSVETALLFTALVALRYRERPSSIRAAVLGLAVSLVVHAHPTAIPSALACLAAAAFHLPKSREGIRHCIALTFAGLLPLMPYALQQWQTGFSDILALGEYATGTLGAPVAPRMLPLFDGVAMYGPEYVWRYWLGLPEKVVQTLELMHAAILLAALIGVTISLSQSRYQHRKLLCVCLALVITQVAFALVLRPITPFWMVYAVLPPLALAIALGIDSLFELATSVRSRRAAVGVAALAALWPITSATALFGIARLPETTWSEVLQPGQQGLMNIVEQHRDRQRITIPRVGIRGVESLAAHDCKPTATFGHLAHLIDMSFGIGRLQRCGTVANLRLGGGLDGRFNTLFALTPGAWRSAGAVPARWVHGLGYSPIDALWTHGVPLSVVTPDTYPPRKPTFTPETYQVKGITRGDQLVVIAHRLDGYYPFNVVRAFAGGKDQVPVYKDSTLSVYRAHAPAQATAWSIEIYGARAVIDVVVVDVAPVPALDGA